MESRTEMMGCRFTKREARIIERLAKAQRINVGQYIHGAVMVACVADGDVDAMRLVGGVVFKKFADAGERMLRHLETIAQPARQRKGPGECW